MAKIDVTKIEGYSEMSAEEKLACLENFEYEDHSADASKFKGAFDKASSEVAELKKQLKSKMSEDEVKAKERQDEWDKIVAERDALLKDKKYGNTVTEYLALGYDRSLAEETAKAFIDGDMTKVFANQKKYQDSLSQTIKADILKSTGRPASGDGTKVITKEDFNNMDMIARTKFKKDYPELFEKYNKV